MSPSRNTWVRLCQWLWKQRSFIWGTVIFGIALNLFASWLITPSGSIFANTPLGTILGNPLLCALVGLGLLALMGGLWLMNRHNPASVSQNALTHLPTQQDRQSVLRLLHQEYNKRLAQSLQGATMMVLRLHERTDMIRSSVQLVFRRTDIVHDSPLLPGTSIVQAYDDAGQRLLILGAPGTGKTTLLLDLARELLTRAESDSTHPIPVILNLASWANKKLPLAAWIIDQIRLVYGIPSRLGQALLEQEQWLLLLDGLDEVEASTLSHCVEAINRHREEHFVPLVICSRSHPYVSQSARLALSSAVEIQLLQEQDVAEYLKRIGKPMAAVRAALRTNPVLKQLLTTPLMLNVVILAYRDKTVRDLPKLGTLEEQQQQIFARYIERMLEQRTIKGDFTPQQTRQWLTWLAQQMQQRHLSEFYVEQLQYDWLSTTHAQILYNAHVWLISILLGWLITALTGGPLYGLLGILAGGMLWGRSSHEMRLRDLLVWSWKSSLQGLTIGLIIGLTSTIIVTVIRGLTDGLIYGLTNGLIGAPPQGPAFAPVGLLIFELIITFPIALTFALTVALTNGLSGVQINERLRSKPNQGIWASGWNALRVGLLGSLSIGLSAWLFLGLRSGLVLSDDGRLSWFWFPTALQYSWYEGLTLGLMGGLIGMITFGGLIYLKHYSLRFLLWRSGTMPWFYVRFLERAHEHILLQRVGGGYRFIHPLFQKYFASLQIETSPNTQAQTPSSQL